MNEQASLARNREELVHIIRDWMLHTCSTNEMAKAEIHVTAKEQFANYKKQMPLL